MNPPRLRRRLNLAELHAAVQGRLVVSCQPVGGGPMDDDATVARMAQAAVAGGAAALRIEGARRLAVVRAAVAVPIVGIVKRDLAHSPVRITPLVADVQALVAAGADIVAVDVTDRPRPVRVAELWAAITAGGAHAMADASCEADALAAWAMGFAIVGTTLSGYTGGFAAAEPAGPDLALVARLARAVQPASHGAMLAEARLLLRKGERDAGLALLEDIREQPRGSGEEEDAWFMAVRILGDLYLDELGRPDLAVGCYVAYRDYQKSGADTLFLLGRAHEATGNVPGAIKAYEAVTMYQNHPRLWEATEAARRLKG